jgi:hypothetical protein
MGRLGNERQEKPAPFNFWFRRWWLDTFTSLQLTALPGGSDRTVLVAGRNAL